MRKTRARLEFALDDRYERSIVGRMGMACALAPNIPSNSSHAFAKLWARKNSQVTFTSAYVSKPSPR
jgi:hypothetical protein